MEKDVAIEEMQTLKSEISAMEGQIKTLEEALGRTEAKVTLSSSEYSCTLGWYTSHYESSRLLSCSDDCMAIWSEFVNLCLLEAWLHSHSLRVTFIY